MRNYADAKDLEVPLRRGEGYLTFMAYLQIFAGALTLLFSLCAILQVVANGNTGLLNPAGMVEAFGWNAGALASLIAGYMVFQISFGWLLGLLMVAAGVCCLKRKGRRLVAAASVLNLINFPHGTTVAIMMLHGLGRPGIAGAFRGRS